MLLIYPKIPKSHFLYAYALVGLLVRVLKGSIALGGRQLVIKATKPKSTKVYSSLAQWRRGEGT